MLNPIRREANGRAQMPAHLLQEVPKCTATFDVLGEDGEYKLDRHTTLPSAIGMQSPRLVDYR